jgi:NTP pyrophosphatase (non-canonical NTP hydrolase)
MAKWEAMGQWVTPDRIDAMGFIATEYGELWDAYLRDKGGYVRNNPGDADEGMHIETGDIVFMAFVLATVEGWDLEQIILDKLARMDREREAACLKSLD